MCGILAVLKSLFTISYINVDWSCDFFFKFQFNHETFFYTIEPLLTPNCIYFFKRGLDWKTKDWREKQW